MIKTRELAKRQSSEMQAPPQAQPREPEIVLRPPVGIYEDADGISLLLEMPGVSKERLNIKADPNGLLIEGNAEISMPEGMEALYAEVRSTYYRRNFTLTAELDADKIDAKLKDGVLTIRIPKRAELRPRRIEVSAS